jgi:UDP-N-acetylglucosamine 1-carboxyvinyltransferase
VIASAPRLRGATIHLGGDQGSTVTGTCNVMTAACLASGTTVIDAAACEPEVEDLGRLLIAMGANIAGLGTSQLIIDGVEELSGADHTVIPDRIEAATLMIASTITGGDVTIQNVVPEQMTAVVELLREVGVSLEFGANTCRVSVPGLLRPVACHALPYPGFPTDVQAQLTALLCLIPGQSVVADKVFPSRFMHVSELLRMGANIRRDGDSALITGVSTLSGANVMASDLRASAALVLAALATRSKTTIHRIYHLDRGYEQLEIKLQQLGASVKRDSGDESKHSPQ